MIDFILVSLNINAVLVSFPIACLAWFVVFCQKNGNILEWYGNLIGRLPMYFSKPLGGCVYCFATWLVLIVAIGFELSFMGVLFSIGYTYFFCNLLAFVID